MARNPNDRATGVSGYDTTYGTVVGIEANREMIGPAKYSNLQLMYVDPIMSGILRIIQTTVLDATWTLKGNRQDLVDYVTPWLMPNLRLVNKPAFKSVVYGSYGFEQIYGPVKQEGKTYIAETALAPRQPWTFWRYVVDSSGTILLRIDQQGPNGKRGHIDTENLVLFVNEPDGNQWDGVSLLRPCWLSYTMKMQYIRTDLVGTRRHQGVLKLTVSGDEAKRNEADEVGEDWYEGAGGHILLDEEGDGVKNADIIMPPGSPPDSIGKIEYYDKSCAHALLSSFTQFSQSGLGSQTEMVVEALERFFAMTSEIANAMANVHNQQRIVRGIDKNFTKVAPEDYPQLIVEGINKPNTERFSEALAVILNAWPEFKAVVSNKDDILIIKKALGLSYELPTMIETEGEEDQTTNTENLTEPTGADCCNHLYGLDSKGFKPNRALTSLENFVDFAGMIVKMDESAETLQAELTRVADVMRGDLVEEFTKAVVDKDADALKAIQAGHQEELKEIMRTAAMASFQQGIDEAKREFEQQTGKKVPKEEPVALAEGDTITDAQGRAAINAGIDVQADLVSDAMTTAGRINALEGLAATDVIDEVAIAAGIETAILATQAARTKPLAQSLTTMALLAGRRQESTRLEPKRTFYSAVMDDKTCDNCAAKDTKEVIDGQPMAPNNMCRSALKGANSCRCVWVNEY